MTGVREEADLAGVALVGGDMATAPQITISVSVVGETAGQAPVLRSGAKPGQVVAVRGRLGWAAAGLAALARGFRSPRAAVDSTRPQVPYGRDDSGAGRRVRHDRRLRRPAGRPAAHRGRQQRRGRLDSARFVIAEPVAAVATALGRDPSASCDRREDHAMAATFDPGRVPADWDVVGRVVEVDPVAGPQVLVDGHAWEGEQGWQYFR